MGNLIKGLKRTIRIVFLMAAVMGMAASAAAAAQDADSKVVRVGWYESTFCYRDQFGRRRGIDYEYQHKISAYTGWTFEYVEDSWANLLQKLMRGEIDLPRLTISTLIPRTRKSRWNIWRPSTGKRSASTREACRKGS